MESGWTLELAEGFKWKTLDVAERETEKKAASSISVEWVGKKDSS
jgi:hypothetical protein